jgi:hypothetical protein
MNRKQFLEVLFDADHVSTCGYDDKGATYPKPVFPDLIPDRGTKFSINPIIDWRNEENVLKAGLFSMLFEMDKTPEGKRIPREEQIRLFKSSGLPFSTMMWSGSKSVHVIVRLDRQIPKDLFKPLWEAIERVLTKHGCFIDPATKKIPQISRMPESIRKLPIYDDDGTIIDYEDSKQDLIEVRTRISLKQIASWLKENGEKVIKPKPIKPFVPIKSDKSNLDKWRIARKWTENKHGSYSSTWTTGGWVWLVNFGINLRKLECSLDQGVNMSRIEWGQWVETNLGKRDIIEPITKGWSWLDNKN